MQVHSPFKSTEIRNSGIELLWIASSQGLVFLSIVGLLLRTFLAIVTQHFNSPELAYIQADGYMKAASFLLQHRYIPDPLFVPAYIYLCAFLQHYFLAHAVTLLIALQVLMDTACIPLIYFLTKRMMGLEAAGFAALLVTFDSLLIVQPGLVLTEALYIPVLLVTVILFVIAFLRPKLDWVAITFYLATGLCAGLGALTRSVGLAIPIALTLVVLISSSRSWRYKGVAILLFCMTFTGAILPTCLGNKTRYGQFSLSDSREFNTAVLIVGPAKVATMTSIGPNLMDMWSDELGPGYQALPPYVLTGRASAIAVHWAKAHPVPVLLSVLEGQASGLVAPNRRSWSAALVWLRPSRHLSQTIYILISGSRLLVAILALVSLARWRTLCLRFRVQGWFLILLVLLILGHVAGAGAVVMGRYFSPVAPYMDILAAGELSILYLNRRERMDR